MYLDSEKEVLKKSLDMLLEFLVDHKNNVYSREDIKANIKQLSDIINDDNKLSKED
jgi:hypothetical protein